MKNGLALAIGLAFLLPCGSASATDHPNKPATVVFRDARVVCPAIVRNLDRRGGHESAVDVLRFAVARHYSKSDTQTLLRLCSLYARDAIRR